MSRSLVVALIMATISGCNQDVLAPEYTCAITWVDDATAVVGQVYRERDPVPGAMVTARDYDGETYHSNVTSDQGCFQVLVRTGPTVVEIEEGTDKVIVQCDLKKLDVRHVLIRFDAESTCESAVD